MSRARLVLGRRTRALAAALAVVSAPTGGGADPAPTPPIHTDVVAPVPSVEERVAEIRRRVQEALVYPSAARERGVSGVTRIRFEVGADRRAARIETTRSSGYPILDEAAEQAARDAGELPMVYGRLEMPVRFALDR